MKTRSMSLCRAACALAVAMVSSSLAAQEVDTDLVNTHFGLEKSEIVTLDLIEASEGRLVAPVVIDGKPLVLYAWPAPVRAEDYQLLEQDESGLLKDVDPGKTSTFRGTIFGWSHSVVAGGMTEHGLIAGIWTESGDRLWIEPVSSKIVNAPPNLYVAYHDHDVAAHDGSCAATTAMRINPVPPGADDGKGDMTLGGTMSVAQLACDADYEYFLDYGSTLAVQARIEAIIASVNVQYERDVDITHEITTIIVRTAEPDPYSSTDAETLLNQFRNHWLANHGGIQRDVAQLFTGKEINSSTIGIAWLNAVCSSFGFGMVQSDFNGTYSCATDLSAHELGHNWGADHCSCTSYTMNPFITCANIFHPTFSIPDITNFRNSISCLDTGDPMGACCVDTNCSIETAADCASMGGTYLGDGTDCVGDPCLPPPPTGACCTLGVCSEVTEADCLAGGGTYQGDGVACESDLCGSAVYNLATGDLSTTWGTIASGSYVDTRTQNDVSEALLEEETNGNPNNRRSRLLHVWTFNVAPGSTYVFHIDAYHDPNSEGDDFTFAYSRDGSSYTDMLTVTKTSDDDVEQTYVFSEDIAGTVYVQVRDTDRTQGNRSTDAVYIDHMYIVSDSGGPDITPPAAPSGLVATAGNGSVSLDWDNNGEGDLDGYTVYRSTSQGGPYAALTGVIANSDYTDGAVTNGTTYYYVVTASDLTGNESGNSDESFATPKAGGGPVSLSVSSITVYTSNAGQGNKRGVADVLILDNEGNPIANATVHGTFTGDINESVSALTSANGVATLITTGTKKGGVSIQFCVDTIDGPLPYDENGNSETCDVN